MNKYTEPFNLTDYEVSKLSLSQLEDIFNTARNVLHPSDFTKWSQDFWAAVNRVRSGANSQNMQAVVEHLDNYKRRLGRAYCNGRSPFIKVRYNEVEISIRWLVQQYEVKRTYKDYLL